MTVEMVESSRISESRRLALLQSEHTLRTIFEEAGIGVSTANTEGVILSCNQSFHKMLGYSAEELIGKNIGDITYLDDADCLQSFRDLVAGKIDRYTVDKRYRRKDGELIWAHIVGSLVRPDGEEPYAVALIENVTERILAQENERKLAEQEKISETQRMQSLERDSRFRAVIEAAGIGVSTADLSGRILTANPAWLKMMGYSNEEITSLNFWDFSHPDDIPVDKELFKQLVEGKIPQYAVVKRYYRKTGEPFWCRVTCTIVHNLDEPSYVVQVVENVTERRRAEENEKKLAAEQAARSEAEDSLALLNSVLQHMPAGVAIIETSGKILLMNRQLHALSEQSASSSSDGSGENSPLLSTLQSAALSKAIEQGEVLEQQEIQYDRADGDRGTLRISAAPVYDVKGRIIAAVTTAYDITESRRAEEALRTSEKLASVGRLAATIAHEINNPLESVTNILYLLASSSVVGSEPKKLVDMAQQELARVVHIVRQTLGFYRESTTPVPVNLGEVIDDVLGLYSRKIEENNAKVTRYFAHVPTVKAFPGEMRQVFSNLVVNALDAIGNNPKGAITIKVSQSRDWRSPGRTGVRVLVSDNGAGIPTEHRKKIFEPFFSTKGEKGTGLGLWVSHGIVQKHGGSMSLRSCQNSGRRPGTTFSVFIPDETAEAADAA
jgi:PAS domain S-box-containing protein